MTSLTIDTPILTTDIKMSVVNDNMDIDDDAMGLDDEVPRVITVTTIDNKKVVIPQHIMNVSKMLRTMFQNNTSNHSELKMSSIHLGWVIDFYTIKSQNKSDDTKVSKYITSTFKDDVSDWEVKFFSSKDTKNVIDLMKTALYLDVTHLLSTCTKYMAHFMKDNTPDQIKNILAPVK